MAHPHLLYCISVWGSTSNNHIQPLIVQHKKIIRSLAKTRVFRDHTSPLYKNLKILKIEDLHNQQVCAFLHKVYYKTATPIISDYINKHQPSQEHRQRFRNNKFNLHKSKYKLEIPRRSLSYSGVNCWNALTLFQQDIALPWKFRKKLKFNFLEKY